MAFSVENKLLMIKSASASISNFLNVPSKYTPCDNPASTFGASSRSTRQSRTWTKAPIFKASKSLHTSVSGRVGPQRSSSMVRIARRASPLGVKYGAVGSCDQEWSDGRRVWSSYDVFCMTVPTKDSSAWFARWDEDVARRLNIRIFGEE